MMRPALGRPRPAGNALVVTLMVLTGSAGLAFLSLSLSRTSQEFSSQMEAETRLRTAATMAADLAVESLWDGFVAAQQGETPDLGSFRNYLDAGPQLLGAPLSASTSAAPLVGNLIGTTQGVTTGSRQTGGGTTPTTSQVVDVLDALALPLDHDGLPKLSGMVISDVAILRTDAANRTDLYVTATARVGADANSPRQTVRQVISVAGEPFHGFEYGLLSNNVNCIMCHAYFDTTDRYYNKDYAKYGTFDRVRVGTLESLLVRTPSSAGRLPLPYSNIAGSLYVRGQLMDNAGGLLKDLTGSTVMGDKFDAQGLLEQSPTGALVPSELTLATGTPLPAFGAMYTNYPSDPALETDGDLPTEFPPPIPDDNGNRKVDAAEFAEVAGAATGTLGSGILYEVANGGSYAGALPASATTGSISGSSSKNLIALGTAANPIQIDGEVAIDGDVVIQGVIRGNGTIVASGNIYILGDLTYADGTDANGNRTFGVSATGATNGLALAAGGNVIVGDYIDDKSGNMVTGDGSGAFNFTMSEIAIFNRGEWAKTQTQLPDKNGKLVTNPLYQAGYMPRYYVMGNGDPVYVYDGGSSGGTSGGSGSKRLTWFDAATKTWAGTEHPAKYSDGLTVHKAGDPVYDQAAIVTLGSRSNWLSESTIKGFWGQVDKTHKSGPMEVDALLYSNNSAWTLVRDTSVYKGQLTLNGGLVAADTGVLVIQNSGVGLQVNYDSRQARKLDLRETTGPVTVTRALSLVTSD